MAVDNSFKCTLRIATAAILWLVAAPCLTHAAVAKIENIAGRACSNGSHTQPQGPYGVFVFCDDAVGTNIAVYYAQLGEPKYEKWTLTRRFWQDEPWAADVSALGWVPGRNLLVVTTSEIYGAGAVFLLNLDVETYEKLGSTNDCGSKILDLTEDSVTVGLNNCEDSKPTKYITMRFPRPRTATP